MRQYTVYECEICGKISSIEKEIVECEASHLGLTLEESIEYQNLKRKVVKASANVAYTKNIKTEAAFDKAIKDMIAFEKKHGIF